MKQITREILRKYSGSDSGDYYMSIIYDAKREILRPVPIELSHIEYVAKMLNVRESELNGNAIHFIPINLGFRMAKKIEINGVMVGLSSLENEMQIPHSRKDIDKTLRLSRNLIEQSGFMKSPNYKEAVFYGFD